MRRYVALAAGLAGLSLLAAGEPTYDPLAWLIWGRQITEGFLDTVAGPSWKPLPVVFTVPFALAGDEAAVALWLFVARLGGLLALAGAWVLARRLGSGTIGAVIAAAGLLTATGVLENVARGASEGLLVAAAVWAVERHLAGRPRSAFALGVAAALLRPEVWPFLALYAAWLVRRSTRRLPAAALVGGCGMAVAAAWFVPEYLGSGDFLRAASRAREPVEGSPGQSDVPFLAVFPNSARALAYPVYIGALLAVGLAWRQRPRDAAVLGVAALAGGLMLIVAMLAQGGFTGNLRYVTLPASLVAVLGGVGWGRLPAVTARRARAALVAVAVPGIVLAAVALGDGVSDLAAHERRYGGLDEVIERAGGARALGACGPVHTGPFQTQALAWELGLRQDEVGLRPDGGPATVVILRDAEDAVPGAERYPIRLQTARWTVRSSC